MDKMTIVRAVVLVGGFVNTWLASKGYEKIPHVDETTVSLVVTGIIATWGFVKHNYIGKKGAEQKAAVEAVKK
jgi:SPP1 family holin